MATTSVSADIATKINVTARKGDSFYLKATLTNEDDTVFDLTDYETISLKITNSNGSLIKEFKNTGTASADTEIVKNNKISKDNTLGTITIDVPAITSLQNTDYINMNLLVGTYDYTLKINSSTDVHTVMYGKFKSID